MKKNIIIFIIISLFIITGCNNKRQMKDNYNEVIKTVKILIDDNEYLINLEDNETSKYFVNLLPQEFNMLELNGNEKYIYLDNTFPVKPSKQKYINKGDVMIYDNNCLVIFYESFETSYSYTKIGHIDNLPNLGNGTIKVIIKK